MLNKDQLSMVPAHPTMQTAYGALTAVQDATPAAQVMAQALLFVQLCDTLKLDPGQMIDAGRRMSRTAADHYSIELRAMRDYIVNEIQFKRT